MGLPPMEFLVLPRVLALVLMMPLLCLYADLIGILGGSLFPEPWEGVVAAVALTLTISAAPVLWRRLRGPSRAHQGGSGSA